MLDTLFLILAYFIGIGIAFCFLAIVGSGILLIINSFIVSIFVAFEKLKWKILYDHIWRIYNVIW